MSHDIGIGKPIVGKATRDATHVAVFPARCKQIVKAGDSVAVLAPKADPLGLIEVVASSTEARIGIVDPFLTVYVPPGIGFWVFLVPGSVTALTHHYHHPLLDAPQEDEVRMGPTIPAYDPAFDDEDDCSDRGC